MERCEVLPKCLSAKPRWHGPHFTGPTKNEGNGLVTTRRREEWELCSFGAGGWQHDLDKVSYARLSQTPSGGEEGLFSGVEYRRLDQCYQLDLALIFAVLKRPKILWDAPDNGR